LKLFNRKGEMVAPKKWYSVWSLEIFFFSAVLLAASNSASPCSVSFLQYVSAGVHATPFSARRSQ